MSGNTKYNTVIITKPAPLSYTAAASSGMTYMGLCVIRRGRRRGGYACSREWWVVVIFKRSTVGLDGRNGLVLSTSLNTKH